MQGSPENCSTCCGGTTDKLLRMAWGIQHNKLVLKKYKIILKKRRMNENKK
jgi:hypothetical protein